MDTKKLVEKFVSGEITDEQFETERAKLTPEAQEQLKKDAEAVMPDAVEKLKGVRRGIEKVATKTGTEEKPDLAEKMRKENYDDAESEIFKKFGIEKDEDKTAFREGFKKHDSGAVNVANIMKDMRSFYASTHADDLLTLEEEKKQREADAEELNAQNAGGGNGSGGGAGTEQKKISKDVKTIMDASAKSGRVLTVEEAEKRLQIMKDKGHIR